MGTLGRTIATLGLVLLIAGILMMLLATNDVAIPIAPKIARLPGERPVLLVATALSLLAVRGLESRAPPALSVSA